MSIEKVQYVKAQNFFAKKLENVEPFSILESDNISVAQKTLDNQFSIINILSGAFFDTKKISDFIKSKNITENVLFMGAFSFVLSRFLGTKECGFVTPSPFVWKNKI